MRDVMARVIRDIQMFRGVDQRAGGVSNPVRDPTGWEILEPGEYTGLESQIREQRFEAHTTFNIDGFPYLTRPPTHQLEA